MSSNNIKLRNELGSYLLGYFRLTVNTDDADFTSLTREEECTFIHEYIHFLQNITTTYGLFLLDCVARKNHLVTWNIQNNSSGESNNEKISRSSSSQLIDFHELEGQLADLIFHTLGGDGTSKDEKELNENENFYKIKKIEEDSFYTIDDEIFPPLKDDSKIIVIYTHDFNDAKEIRVELGAICLMEAMAVIIENHIGNIGKTKNPKSPYLIAKDVASFLLEIDVSDSILCIVCELALQSRSPGAEFYKILSLIRVHYRERIISLSNNYSELRECLLKISNGYTYFLTVSDNENDNLENAKKLDLKKYIIKKTKDDFGFFFNGDLGLGFKLTELIEYIIDHFNDQDNLLFISDLLSESVGDKRKIYKVIKDKGTPLLFTNTAFVGHYFPDKNKDFDSQFFYLSVLSDYLNLVKGNTNSCSHYLACKSFNNATANSDCTDNPRNKANERKLCPLGLFLKVFGA